MVVDMGNEFPSSIQEALNSLDCSILFRSTPHRQTTRANNHYGPGELRSTTLVDLAEDRDFRYLTPKLQITPNDLSPTLLASKTFILYPILSEQSRQ
jgi:hypothetical protein